MTALTKGPLPARVYWFRRLVLLGVAFALVFTTARLLGGSSDGKGDKEAVKATNASAETTPDAVETTAAPDPSETAAAETGEPETETKAERKARRKAEREAEKAAATPTPPPLPEPSGPCAAGDVLVTPVVGEVRAAGDVEIGLAFRSVATAACTWTVSADTVTVKITSGKDDIWASRQCRQAVPTQDIVVYQQQDTVVPMFWSGRRSDEECSKLTEWARPGFYHVKAAAYAGEPVDVQFELRVPAPVTVTKTVKPKKDKKNKGADSTVTTDPSAQPTAEPSGAVEPNG